MTKVAVFAKMTAHQGRRAELVSAIEAFFPDVEDEATTEVYALHLDADHADALYFYELFSDEAAMRAHARSDKLRALLEKTASLVAGPPHVTLLTPVKAKGVTL